MLRTALFTALVCAIGLISCVKKDYNCYCLADLPDTAGLSLDYDTTIVLSARADQVAETECQAFEEGSALIIPDAVSSDVLEVTCDIQ